MEYAVKITEYGLIKDVIALENINLATNCANANVASKKVISLFYCDACK